MQLGARPSRCSGWRPASQSDALEDSPFGEYSYGAEVFGETPKTAVETTALPKNLLRIGVKKCGHAQFPYSFHEGERARSLAATLGNVSKT
jgi:hypothetical protein